jgi:hypothetical protein
MALADNVASVVNAALSPVALLQPVGRVGLDPAMKLTAAHYHKLGSWKAGKGLERRTWYNRPSVADCTIWTIPFDPANVEGTVTGSHRFPRAAWETTGERYVKLLVAVWSRVARNAQCAVGWVLVRAI